MTHVRVEAYCHLPFDLAKEHGAMSLGLDIERKLSHAMEAFAFAADATEQGMAEGIIDGADGFKADEHAFEVGTIPAGFGLTDGPAARLGEDGRVYVDRRAMEAAAEDFEHRTGRKPLPVELVKALLDAGASPLHLVYGRKAKTVSKGEECYKLLADAEAKAAAAGA